jgi:aspartyl protease family protein
MWKSPLSYLCLATTVFGLTVSHANDDGAASAMTARVIVEQPSENPATEGIRRASNGLFYVTANVGSGDARFIVDTGASHVILSHSDARKSITRSNRKKTQDLMTAGGAIAVDWVVLDTLVIEGQVLRNVEAAIPQRDVGVSLLGQSALAQFSNVWIKGDQLTLSK